MIERLRKLLEKYENEMYYLDARCWSRPYNADWSRLQDVRTLVYELRDVLQGC